MGARRETRKAQAGEPIGPSSRTASDPNGERDGGEARREGKEARPSFAEENRDDAKEESDQPRVRAYPEEGTGSKTQEEKPSGPLRRLELERHDGKQNRPGQCPGHDRAQRLAEPEGENQHHV